MVDETKLQLQGAVPIGWHLDLGVRRNMWDPRFNPGKKTAQDYQGLNEVPSESCGTGVMSWRMMQPNSFKDRKSIH